MKQPNKEILVPPISLALKRVTKKPFGIKVSPGHSPVSPEKFSGYHTGVDFEILAGEEKKEVPVYAICSGKLLLKKWISGYGGVAVESCWINGQDATVVYGHLRLSGIGIKSGEKISGGKKIGTLGNAHSPEADGERKHLHLGIHKGLAVNLRGYVQNKSQLNNWLDVTKYLK